MATCAEKNNFTLIEIVIALAILAIGLGGMLQLALSAQLQMANAQEKWQQQHAINQAAEYLLMLDGEETDVPEEFFPYAEIYTLNVENSEPDDLPEEFSNIEGQAELKKLVIELVRNRDGKTVERVIVDRFSYEDDTE